MDSTLACLAAWMPRQRWYAAKGRPPSLRLISWWDFPADDQDARVRTYLVADEGALPVVLYQVPVVARPTTTVTASGAHVIGSPEPGTTFIDGPHDPAYVGALMGLVLGGGTVSGPHATATGHPLVAADDDEGPVSAHVLNGEQSNTSLIAPATASRPAVICKIFRQVNQGRNPDIELQTALAGAGSPHIAPAVGWVEGTWLDPGAAQQTVGGSLAFAQRFFSGVEDAWRVALRAAADGTPFDREAHALGRATADVHLSLAHLFPTRPAEPRDVDGFAETWRRRLSIALAEVPAIAERRTAIEAVYARASSARPTLQRIHGDYHLGQVLHTENGWVLLDFEGEPMRPIRERVRPDAALRDVAGMLRSFDYVAGSIRLDDPARPAAAVRAWVDAARAAFLAGYAEATGDPLDADDPLLAALELDKAVYEAIYEARNRPTWVTIPLRAIGRLAATHPA
ncbi:maltokinase N-terminal cap-like domain-containing protein [Microbacterium terricola]|uniref:Maltokinase n=1 Tax=Microbacterium terricola TaxID=344163 RepID=A0ABM8DZC2_9MICO|nr:phosphotransferase [Microbacterium terricola]UYK41257.1 aminoglycoside phosphotransferase [Microbacterium terricola]BDV30964.1 trehalose biosynthesis protein [Microbacterium terricola]